MCFRQPLGDLVQEFEQNLQLALSRVSLLSQRLAIDKLHRNEVSAFALANLIDVRDVGMIERGCGLRLLNETAHAIFVCSDIAGQNFQHDGAPELQIFGEINLAHSALANLRADLVTAEFGAWD